DHVCKEGGRAARGFKSGRLATARILGPAARVVLSKSFPACSAAAIHVYFPDPWWKRRHKKRRIFTAEFLEQAARILVPGGQLHAWTDVKEYFGMMTDLVAGNPPFLP